MQHGWITPLFDYSFQSWCQHFYAIFFSKLGFPHIELNLVLSSQFRKSKTVIANIRKYIGNQQPQQQLYKPLRPGVISCDNGGSKQRHSLMFVMRCLICLNIAVRAYIFHNNFQLSSSLRIHKQKHLLFCFPKKKEKIIVPALQTISGVTRAFKTSIYHNVEYTIFRLTPSRRCEAVRFCQRANDFKFI